MSDKSIKGGNGPPQNDPATPGPVSPSRAMPPGPDNPALPKVPAGLTRCPNCGHFKGECLQDGKPWIITCCCSLNICDRCKTPVYKYKIGTNFYDEFDGRCWRVPIHHAWAHRCPDGVRGQLKNSFLINLQTGKDLLSGKTFSTPEALLEEREDDKD